MRKYKYLSDLGVKPESQYLNWLVDTENDPRAEEWKLQRDIYGIDERETWSWCSDYMDYVYIHLKMFDEVNIVDMNAHNIVFDGEEHTVQEMIDRVLDWFESIYYPTDGGENLFDVNNTPEENKRVIDEYYKGYQDTLVIVAKMMPYLWW